MRSSVEENVVYARGEELNVTVSAGLTIVNPGDNVKMEALINEADEAMYEAKERGKNTVVCFREDDQQVHV